MGVSDAPQWLISAYVRSAQAVGATSDKEALTKFCQTLLERWSSEGRVFHNLRHLINTLAALDEISGVSHDPDILRMAAWYHGAVFSTEETHTQARDAGEVMAPSADYARQDLEAMGVPTENVERICQLILVLGKHTAPADDIDAHVLIDAELSMLAATPQEYRDYCQAIAEEYSHIPTLRFLCARRAVVSHLLARRPLFTSPLGNQWEAGAKQNLEAELAKLNAKLEAFAKEEVAAAQAAEDSTLGAKQAEAEEANKLVCPVEDLPATSTIMIKAIKAASPEADDLSYSPVGIADPSETPEDMAPSNSVLGLPPEKDIPALARMSLAQRQAELAQKAKDSAREQQTESATTDSKTDLDTRFVVDSEISKITSTLEELPDDEPRDLVEIESPSNESSEDKSETENLENSGAIRQSIFAAVKSVNESEAKPADLAPAADSEADLAPVEPVAQSIEDAPLAQTNEDAHAEPELDPVVTTGIHSTKEQAPTELSLEEEEDDLASEGGSSLESAVDCLDIADKKRVKNGGRRPGEAVPTMTPPADEK
ncbi:hypothetical protein BK816_06835 [Boudabousia tangfeifanii]|uniref:HD domain-containing protein n=1 Tax=Boudabousia tangfeifanii TaxID=1912795 RepID=A0A1D9ML63_9ACTO|nr:hypothetical protein [Boudabousia tangfeifanii]AOZ73036.1 hypothetical protein BK816_06835 [Boudabousia tangfeifanii]